MEVITQDRIDELKAKLALLDGDRKAYLEGAIHALSENKKRVAELRFENNRLRTILREGLSAEDHIINHVFHNRQADKACLANKSGSEAITVMDYRTCDVMKKYNALKHLTVQKEEKIEQLKKTYYELKQLMDDENATTAGTNKEGRHLRELENRLDKAQLKYQEAEHIKRTYMQIKDKLQEEQLTYGHSLDALEKQIRLANEELAELQTMFNNAVLSRDAAQKELKYQEEVIMNERKRRETELTSMKRVAEGKKTPSDKTMHTRELLVQETLHDPLKKEHSRSFRIVPFPSESGFELPVDWVLLFRSKIAEQNPDKTIGKHEAARDSITEDAQGESGEGSAEQSGGERGSGAAGITEEQHQKIVAFEEAFRQIKEVTGLSDLNQIVKRFENQGDTLTHLQELKEKAEKQCQALREERDRLQLQFEELRYSGETELASINQLLQKHRGEADKEAERREQLHENVAEVSRLLVQCKAAVDHIHDKLTSLNVGVLAPEKPADSSTEGQLPEMLKQCNVRLDELMNSLQDVSVDEQLQLMEEEEFFSKLEGKMPDYNTRIKLPSSVRETAHEDDDLGGDENDILTRTALKKQSQQIVEMRNKKRQTRKKKRRSK